MNITIQPTQACQVKVGDWLQTKHEAWQVISKVPQPFGQVAITIKHPDSAIIEVRKYGITSMTSVVVTK